MSYQPKVYRDEGGDRITIADGGTIRRGDSIQLKSNALAAAATIAVNFNLGSMFTLTPAQNETLNASGGYAGEIATIVITTSGTTSYTLTFGTNFKSAGTLATGTVDGKVFTITFAYDGTNWCELSRTTAM